MTTMISPSGATPTDASAARLLTLTANLLPPEVIERRQVVRLRQIVLISLGTALVLLATGYAIASHRSSSEQDKVDTAERQALVLRQQQRGYTELVDAQTQSTTINRQLATLLATDVEWARLFGSLRAAAPRGLALTSLGVALTDPTTGGDTGSGTGSTTASGLPSADGTSPIGTLTISGTSSSKAAIANYLDTVATVTGVGNTLLSGVTDQDSGADFTLRADLSPVALSHHYTTASSD